MAMTRRYGRITVEVSNPDKVLFPDPAITKGDLIDYYEKIADVMLPHLQGRIVTMGRYPDAIDGKGFFQKEYPTTFRAGSSGS